MIPKITWAVLVLFVVASAANGEERTSARLLSALSKDGFTFSPTDTVIGSRVSGPICAAAHKGKLFLYYWQHAETMNPSSGQLNVATSDDAGRSWRSEHVRILDDQNVESRPRLVAILPPSGPDQSFRLLYNESPRSFVLFLGESENGVTFTKKHIAFAMPEFHGVLTGIVAMLLENTWHVYVRNSSGDHFGTAWHGVLTESLSIRQASPLIARFQDGDAKSYNPWSGIHLDGGRSRVYASPFLGGPPRSFITSDGKTFKIETDRPVTLNSNDKPVVPVMKLWYVMRHPNNGYMMFYEAE